MSQNQSQSQNLCSSSIGDDDSGGGESSWTPYFVDFVINNQQSYSGHDQSSSSMVSYNTAASSPLPKKFNNYETRKCKKLNFNRRKTQQSSLIDEDLEDTASSPNNSPKVCGLRKMEIYPRKEEKLDKYSVDKTVSEESHEDEKGFMGKEHESILCQW